MDKFIKINKKNELYLNEKYLKHDNLLDLMAQIYFQN